MTVQRLRCIRCDKPDRTARLVAFEGESISELRDRARVENGWRTVPSFEAGGRTDNCRIHA
jgi:hypothetical protein